MKPLLLFALLVGCDAHGTQPADAPLFPDPPPFPVNVHWQFADSAGAAQPCPDAGATVDVIPIYMRRGPQPPINVPCSDGLVRVVLDAEPKEDSAVQVRVLRGDGSPYAITPMQLAHSSDLVFVVITDRGRISAHWTHHRGGIDIRCADLGNPVATVTFTPSVGPAVTVTNADCERGASSGDLSTGATVRIDVMSGGGAGFVENVSVPTGGLTADSPTIAIGIP